MHVARQYGLVLNIEKCDIRVPCVKFFGCYSNKDGKPNVFASKALTKVVQRYANIVREKLAVVFGCKRFHTYLYGKFI